MEERKLGGNEWGTVSHNPFFMWVRHAYSKIDEV